MLKFCRPSILNGIPNVVSRGDLASRAISVELQPIGESGRREEEEIEGEFQRHLAGGLGALCDAVSAALRQEVEIREQYSGKLPRMADAASFVTAGVESLGFRRGDFLEALDRAAQETQRDLAENDPGCAGDPWRLGRSAGQNRPRDPSAPVPMGAWTM